MKLVVFSDIHYASEPPVHKGEKGRRKLTQFALPITEKLIEDINNLIKPDVVISLGDLIEDLKEFDKDIENFNYIWNVLKTIKAPFYSTIGNTEVRSISLDKLKEIMGYDNITFSVDVSGYHLIFLGITIKYNDDGTYKIEILKNDLEWLQNDLEKNTLPALFFTHYGIAFDEMKGNWWYEHRPEVAVLSECKEIKQIIEKDNNIVAVFSGHQHWTKMITENGILYYIVGSLVENINDDGIPDGVYLEVDLDKKNLEVVEHHIRLKRVK